MLAIRRRGIEATRTPAPAVISVSGNTVGVTDLSDLVAPTVPVIAATAVSTSQISISLTTASTDAGSGLKEYVLERSPNGSSSWTELARGSTIFGYSNTGLSASTTYYYRAKAIDNAVNESAYSSTSSATTQSSVPTGALFVDSFDTGSFAPAQNGWSWGSTLIGTNRGTIGISTDLAKSGTRSLKFAHANGNADNWLEQRYGSSLVGGYQELWIAYWMRVVNYTRLGPPNSGNTYNNKLGYFWTGADSQYSSLSGCTLGIEFFQGTTTGNTPTSVDGETFYTLVDTTLSGYQHHDFAGSFLRVSDRNKWIHYIHRLKMGTGAGNDGLFQIWRKAEDEANYIRTVNQATRAFRSGAGGLRSCYLRGWHDAGYSNGVPIWYIDDFQVADSNIWSVT